MEPELLIDDSVWGKPNLEPALRHKQSDLFKKLLEYRIPVKDQFGNRFLKIPTRELIQMLTGFARVSYQVQDSDIKKALKEFGMIVTRDQYLFVSNYNDQLEKIFGLKNWNHLLLRSISGSKLSQPKRFFDNSCRGILIPLANFIDQEIYW